MEKALSEYISLSKNIETLNLEKKLKLKVNLKTQHAEKQGWYQHQLRSDIAGTDCCT